jgi:hypothetical protein
MPINIARLAVAQSMVFAALDLIVSFVYVTEDLY